MNNRKTLVPTRETEFKSSQVNPAASGYIHAFMIFPFYLNLPWSECRGNLSVLTVMGRGLSGSWLVPTVEAPTGLGWSWPGCFVLCPCIVPGHVSSSRSLSAYIHHFSHILPAQSPHNLPPLCPRLFWTVGILKTSLVPSWISRMYWNSFIPLKPLWNWKHIRPPCLVTSLDYF